MNGRGGGWVRDLSSMGDGGDDSDGEFKSSRSSSEFQGSGYWHGDGAAASGDVSSRASASCGVANPVPFDVVQTFPLPPPAEDGVGDTGKGVKSRGSTTGPISPGAAVEVIKSRRMASLVSGSSNVSHDSATAEVAEPLSMGEHAWPVMHGSDGLNPRSRLHTDGMRNNQFRRRWSPPPRFYAENGQHLMRRSSGSYLNLDFDMAILTQTSFALDKEHQVHIPDEDEMTAVDVAKTDADAVENDHSVAAEASPLRRTDVVYQDREYVDKSLIDGSNLDMDVAVTEGARLLQGEPTLFYDDQLKNGGRVSPRRSTLQGSSSPTFRRKGSDCSAISFHSSSDAPHSPNKYSLVQTCGPHAHSNTTHKGFRWKLFWAYTGPGWLMSVAYLDPGNIESDLQAGSYSGYQLIWVLAVSTLLGFFLQVLAARLGVVTGKNLAENCREHFGAGDTYVLYAMMQVAIVGSDIQEIVGSAIAFKVLFGFPLWVGCLLTGLDTLTFLGLHIIGVRSLELFFVFLIMCMCACFFGTFFVDPADPWGMARGFFLPEVPSRATVQAVSILGAVVMPHNIYLHSALVLSRDIDRTRHAKVAEANYYFSMEAGAALFVSLLINCAVVAVFAHGFYSPTCQAINHPLELYPIAAHVEPPFACVPTSEQHQSGDVLVKTSISCETESGVMGTCMPIGLQGAAHALEAFLGKAASIMWAVGLLAAGQSSTMTGTYAGQFVMEGFLQLDIPNWVRIGLTRAISLIPATLVAVLANSNYLAADRLDETLNVFQSLQLPFALLPLLGFTSSVKHMGGFANSNIVRAMGWTATLLVLTINAYLVWETVDPVNVAPVVLAFYAAIAIAYVYVVLRLARDAWNLRTATHVPPPKICRPGPHEKEKLPSIEQKTGINGMYTTNGVMGGERSREG